MVPALTSTILLIEDEYNLRQSLQLILNYAGYTVRTTQNCSDVSNMFENTDYDLVILSLHNSDKHALGQIANIRASFPNIPLMVLAANEASVFAGANRGCAEDYLVKPVDPNLILAHINAILK